MTARTPRKRKTIVEETLPEGYDDSGEPTSEFDVSLESVEDAETLKTVLENFGQTDNVTYRVYKQVPTGPPSFQYQSSTFDEEFLQRERGAGIYTVRVFINGKFKRAITVQCDAPLNGTATPSSPRDHHSEFLEKMLLTIMARENPVSATPAPTMPEIISAISQLDGLRGKQESAMETFIKGLELGRTFDGGGGGPSDWKSMLMGVVKDAAPHAIPAISSIIAARTNGGIPPNPNPVNPNPAPVIPQTPEQEAMLLEMMLKQGIATLKQQFAAGLDPDSAVDFVRIQAGLKPEYMQLVTAVLNMDYAELAKLDPDIGKEPFLTPFRSFIDGLRSEFVPEDSVDDDPGRVVGNEDDSRNNGLHSASRTAGPKVK